MFYPSLEEVSKASHLQICQWYRFLPTPSKQVKFINENQYRDEVNKNVEVLNAITKRFQELGGFTPEISNQLGFKNHYL